MMRGLGYQSHHFAPGTSGATLNFNFLNDGLDPRITFTRASTATYFNSIGVLTSAAIDAPRFDYNPATLAAQGLLIEEARTNSLTYSESLRTQTLTVTITSGTFQNGETVTATGGGTGTYISASSTPTSFGIWNGSGAFTGTLTGGTSGATATISSFLNEWSLTRSTASPDVVTAPSGTVSADKLVEDTTASNTHFLSAKSVSVVTTSVYALSVFLKAAERTWALVNTGGTPFGTNGVYIDLSTGALGSTVGTLDSAPTVQNCGNGWYRVTITKTPTTNGGGQIQVRLATGNGTTTYTGDGTSGIYVWGAQLEAGAFPTSYIPTTTTALTRSADVASVNTLSPWYNSTQGTLYAEAQISAGIGSTPAAFASLDDTTTSNRIQLRRATPGNLANFRMVSSAGSTDVTLASGTLTGVNKTAAAFTASNQNAVNNGTLFTGITPIASLPTITRLLLGDGIGSLPINGWLRRVSYYPRRLSDAELQTITA